MKRLSLTLLFAAGLVLPEAHAQIRDTLLWVAGPWMSADPAETTPAFNIGMPPTVFLTFGKDGRFAMSLSLKGGGEDVQNAKNSTDWLVRMGLEKSASVMTHPFFMAGAYAVAGDGAERRITLNVREVSTAPEHAPFKAALGPMRFGVENGRVDPTAFKLQGLLTDDGTLVLFSGRRRAAFRAVK